MKGNVLKTLKNKKEMETKEVEQEESPVEPIIPEPGKIRAYTQSYFHSVEDEEGNEIKCATEYEAKVLSLLVKVNKAITDIGE